MSNNIYVVAEVHTIAGMADAMREALLKLTAAVQSEPGCIRYDLHESPDNPGNFMFYETWSDAEALDVHNNTATMKAHVEKAGGWVAAINVNTYRRIS